MQDPLHLLRTQLHAETAQIPWAELQDFFVKGVLIVVSSELDLVDVAVHIASDDTTRVQAWMAAGQLARLADQTAADWEARDPFLWAVVVAPWILVQERSQ